MTWHDLKVWWWWSFGLSLVFAWIGAIPVYVFNAPEVVGMVFAAPGALLLFGMLFYGVISLIIEGVATVLAFFGLFTRKGRRRLFGSTPVVTDSG